MYTSLYMDCCCTYIHKEHHIPPTVVRASTGSMGWCFSHSDAGFPSNAYTGSRSHNTKLQPAAAAAAVAMLMVEPGVFRQKQESPARGGEERERERTRTRWVEWRNLEPGNAREEDKATVPRMEWSRFGGIKLSNGMVSSERAASGGIRDSVSP